MKTSEYRVVVREGAGDGELVGEYAFTTASGFADLGAAVRLIEKSLAAGYRVEAFWQDTPEHSETAENCPCDDCRAAREA